MANSRHLKSEICAEIKTYKPRKSAAADTKQQSGINKLTVIQGGAEKRQRGENFHHQSGAGGHQSETSRLNRILLT